MIVYLIRNKVSGKCYVGQTRRTADARFAAHKKVIGRRNACRALSDAMVKYGFANFEISVLQQCVSATELDAAEKRWIASLGTFAPGGYNLTLGGGGKSGYRHSEESRRKMSAWQVGKVLTPEHRAKVSASLIGNQHAKGMKHSEATKALIAAKGMGRKPPPRSAATRAAIAAARRGTKASAEARRKMSIAQLKRNARVRAGAVTGDLFTEDT